LRGNAHGGFGGAGRRNGPLREHGTALRPDPTTTATPTGLAAAPGTRPRIARRGIEPSQRLGRHRYVVERSLAWLVGYRRLQVRYERRAEILLGFLHLACALICLKSLNQPTATGPFVS
jgi:hypothetical protein